MDPYTCSSRENNNEIKNEDLSSSSSSMVAPAAGEEIQVTEGGDSFSVFAEQEERRLESGGFSAPTASGGCNRDVQDWIPPLGWKFSPRDTELVVSYLVNKVFGRPLPYDIIKEIDLYQYDPPQLPINEFKYTKPNMAYFFTSIVRRCSTGLPKRTTNGGYWKASGPDENIYYNGKVIGFKKILKFYWGKAPSKEQSPWIMHEFRINPSFYQADVMEDEAIRSKMENCVVCKIKQK